MAIGALQTGYNTLYGKVAGLGTQNGQTRGSSFREHIEMCIRDRVEDERTRIAKEMDW